MHAFDAAQVEDYTLSARMADEGQKLQQYGW